jgi:hypothetical protein
MRIGIMHGRKYYLRYVVTALDALVERGHHLLFATSEKKAKSMKIPRSLADHPSVSRALYPFARDDALEPAQRLIRALRDAARYETPALRGAHHNRDRAYRKLQETLTAEGISYPVEPPRHEIDPSDRAALDTVLAALDRLIPPSRPMVEFLTGQDLDAAVAITRVNFGGNEVGLVRAAQASGIPVGLIVWSWDNLSSKSLVHEPPDRLFVWNEVQAREAVELHGLDPATIEVTGAPRFDEFFALRPTASRAELLAAESLDPDRKTLLYLGSSGFVTKSEPEFIDEWVAALRASAEPSLRDANVLVRPHPGAYDEPAWTAWKPGADIAFPTLRRRAQQLFDQLFVADAVVALNTSAELEAAVVGRPVLTITVGDRAPGQKGTAHFSYLLAGHGGFVETAGALDEHVGQLLRALEEDPHAVARSRFVESFLRPHGIDRPAGPVLAAGIERLATRPGDSP